MQQALGESAGEKGMRQASGKSAGASRFGFRRLRVPSKAKIHVPALKLGIYAGARLMEHLTPFSGELPADGVAEEGAGRRRRCGGLLR